jgi:hypothetical protein
MIKKRPFGATFLAILALLAVIVSAFHALQYFGVFPGQLVFFISDYIGGILQGLLALVWIWWTIRLWNADPKVRVQIITTSVVNIVVDILSLLAGTSYNVLWPSLAVNIIILIFIFLPVAKKAFVTQ